MLHHELAKQWRQIAIIELIIIGLMGVGMSWKSTEYKQCSCSLVELQCEENSFVEKEEVLQEDGTPPKVETQVETEDLECDFSEDGTYSGQYLVAYEVWSFLTDYGYSEYVTAGIIGNMMRESGGDTLSLNSTIWSTNNTHYGLCQWSYFYYPEIANGSTQEQLVFLTGNIESAFNSYGGNYADGFTYQDFLALTNEQDAALAFSKAYERGSSAEDYKRQNNATTALEYFTS